MGFNIAIDGPAGAGKSTVARRAAAELGFIYVDTGAMYRTIALGLKRRGTDTSDEAALTAALAGMDIGIRYADGQQQMLLDGEDVSSLIRTREISELASQAAALPAVRARLLELQRDMAASADVLMDGRDIGTQILPQAQLKIYLTASVDERARRRFLELQEKGEAGDLAAIAEEIARRDERDMNRDVSPLRQADDAVLLDTSNLDIREAVAVICTLAKIRMEKAEQG